MAIVPIAELYRDYVTDGVPDSGVYDPKKADIRDTLIDRLTSRTSTIVYILAHSWGWTNYLAVRLQEVIGDDFKVINASVGGAKLDEIRARAPQAVLNNNDADIVVLIPFINSMLADDTVSEITTEYQGLINDIKSANPNTKVLICTEGPFKPYLTDDGSDFPNGPDDFAYPNNWTSGRQAVLDGVNTWVMNSAANVDARADLYSGLEDPSVPDTMRNDARRDHYHPSYTTGVNIEVDILVATGIFEAVDGGKALRAGKNVVITQDLTVGSDILVHTVSAGFEPTILIGSPNSSQRNFAAFNSRQGDGVSEGYNWYDASAFSAGRGHYGVSTNSGVYAIGNLYDGVDYGALLLLGRTIVTSVRNDNGFRVVGTTFDGTSGYGEVIAPMGSPGGMIQTTFTSGGSAFGAKHYNAGTHQFQIGGTGTWEIHTDGTLRPTTDSGRNLGDASHRIATVYAATGTINTSDAEMKSNFGPLAKSDELQRALLLAALDTEQAFYQWKDAIAAKGNDARWHFGPTAQGFRDACLARGVDPRTVAAYCEDDATEPFKRKEFVKRQAMTKETRTSTEIRLVDGVATRVTIEEEVDVPLFEKVPLFNEDGSRAQRTEFQLSAKGNMEPVQVDDFYPQPVMEEVEIEVDGVRPKLGKDGKQMKVHGLRLDQFDRIVSYARWLVYRGELDWQPLHLQA